MSWIARRSPLRLPRPETRRLVSAVALLLLVACGGSGGGSPTAPGARSESEVEALSFDLVNRTRSDERVGPALAWDEAVAAVAREHSRDMRDRGFFSHVDPEGDDFADRLRDAGIPFTGVSENLARVTDAPNPAAFAHERFLENPAHRANILDPRFTHAGVGVARRGSTYWITQVFVRR